MRRCGNASSSFLPLNKQPRGDDNAGSGNKSRTSSIKVSIYHFIQSVHVPQHRSSLNKQPASSHGSNAGFDKRSKVSLTADMPISSFLLEIAQWSQRRHQISHFDHDRQRWHSWRSFWTHRLETQTQIGSCTYHLRDFCSHEDRWLETQTQVGSCRYLQDFCSREDHRQFLGWRRQHWASGNDTESAQGNEAALKRGKSFPLGLLCSDRFARTSSRSNRHPTQGRAVRWKKYSVNRRQPVGPGRSYQISPTATSMCYVHGQRQKRSRNVPRNSGTGGSELPCHWRSQIAQHTCNSYAFTSIPNSGLIILQLNQKLCDVRTHAASSALTSLDNQFRLVSDINPNLPEDDITELRREYAQDLFDNKKFIFGKYVIAKDGTVWSFDWCLDQLLTLYNRLRKRNHIRVRSYCEHSHRASGSSRMSRRMNQVPHCQQVVIRKPCLRLLQQR